MRVTSISFTLQIVVTTIHTNYITVMAQHFLDQTFDTLQHTCVTLTTFPYVVVIMKITQNYYFNKTYN